MPHKGKPILNVSHIGVKLAPARAHAVWDGPLRLNTDFFLGFPKNISHEPHFTVDNQTNSTDSAGLSFSLVASFSVCFGLLPCL